MLEARRGRRPTAHGCACVVPEPLCPVQLVRKRDWLAGDMNVELNNPVEGDDPLDNQTKVLARDANPERAA